MSDDYATAIHKAFQGEVYGEALFRGLAERATDPGRAWKWRVLERLETETKERIRPLAEQLCGEVREDAAECERGEKDAAQFSPIPWPSLMGGFRNELLNFVAESPDQQIIVGTESGILHTMHKAAPHKELIPAPVEAEPLELLRVTQAAHPVAEEHEAVAVLNVIRVRALGRLGPVAYHLEHHVEGGKREHAHHHPAHSLGDLEPGVRPGEVLTQQLVQHRLPVPVVSDRGV